MVVRLILPVVKACPITTGFSASTVLTLRDCQLAPVERTPFAELARCALCPPCGPALGGGCRNCPRRRHKA